MTDPIRNWTPPSTDGRMALENFYLYIAMSAGTKDGRVPRVEEVTPTLANVDSVFDRMFRRACA